MRIVLPLALACFATTALAGFFYPEGATTLHFAFEGSPNGDRPIVRAPTPYYADDGYGFVDSPDLIGTANSVTAPKYFRFDANVPPGNYDVTVRLGGPAAGNVTVRAEAYRVMAYNVDVPARGSVNETFTVAVLGGKATVKAIDLDNRLSLELSGANPSMMKLDIKPNTSAATVWIIGDAASMDHEDLPHTGWGQMLPMFFKSGEIAVANMPANVAIDAGFFNGLKKGDCVLSLGRQDENEIAKHGATIFQLPGNVIKQDPNLSAYTAFENAKRVAMAIRDAKLPLAEHLYPDIPALNDDPAKFPPGLAQPNP